MKYKSNKFNYFLKVLLDGADLVETFEIINPFTDGLGMGIRNYPKLIRQGVKEVIDLKQENTDLKDDLEFAEDLLRDYRDFIPLDPEDLTDENKEKIKEFLEKLGEEVEEWIF